MPDRLPSLDLLLDFVQAERDKQLAHFDAFDNKAKGRRVGLALRALALAAGPMAVGIVVDAL